MFLETPLAVGWRRAFGGWGERDVEEGRPDRRLLPPSTDDDGDKVFNTQIKLLFEEEQFQVKGISSNTNEKTFQNELCGLNTITYQSLGLNFYKTGHKMLS